MGNPYRSRRVGAATPTVAATVVEVEKIATRRVDRTELEEFLRRRHRS
jgi:hypothetical protein